MSQIWELADVARAPILSCWGGTDMDVFGVRDQLIDDCLQLIGSFVDLRDKNTLKHASDRLLRERRGQQPPQGTAEVSNDHLPRKPVGDVRPRHLPGVGRREGKGPRGPARQPARQFRRARVRSHQAQRPWLGRGSQSRQFLVLDELHTYRLQESN